MNLESMYKKTKDNKPNQLFVNSLAVVLCIIIVLGIVYTFSLMWNYIAPIWNFPTLNYIQFLISLLLLRLFSMIIFSSGRNQGDYKMIRFNGDNPHEKE